MTLSKLDEAKTYEAGSYRFILTLVDQERGKQMSISVPELEVLRRKGIANSPSPVNAMLDRFTASLKDGDK